MSKANDFNEFSTGCKCNMWQLYLALSDSLSKTFLNSTFRRKNLIDSESTFGCVTLCDMFLIHSCPWELQNLKFNLSLQTFLNFFLPFPRFWLFCVTKRMIQKMLNFRREHSLCDSTDVILLQRPEHNDFVQPDSKHDSAVAMTKHEKRFFSVQEVACQTSSEEATCWGILVWRNSSSPEAIGTEMQNEMRKTQW